MKIGLISDTHGYMDDALSDSFRDCEEIWHAGDIGDIKVIHQLEKVAPVKAVYGNIDDHNIRAEITKDQIFMCHNYKVWITHIGAYPPYYNKIILDRLDDIQPDIFICGHSHILKVIPDKKRNLLHINPGAAGKHGLHQVRTLITLHIEPNKIFDLKVLEFKRY